MAKRYVEKQREDDSYIYRIDRQTKKGEYNLNSDEDNKQYKIVKKIKLEGFDSFPSGLWREGYGFTAAGAWLLPKLGDLFGKKLRVTLSKTAPCGVRKTKTQVVVTVNHNRLKALNDVFRAIKSERNKELRLIADAFLGKHFSDHFDEVDASLLEYPPGKIARMLEDETVVDNLSDEDKAALRAVFPSLVDEMEFSLRSAAKVKLVADGIKKSKKVYLKKTIDEFESKLTKSASENTWQKFLQQHILNLLNTYAFVIEKQSVEMDGKYPDFMLIDAYGYLDVYEIKKPQTNLLKYDRGRKNYYWDTELSKAITQTEKYMSSVQRNQYELETKFRKQNVNAHIVRPRGFIIAGKRADLTDEAMRDDFRVLNDSLKNIDIICFDDLLDNLKALFDRLND